MTTPRKESGRRLAYLTPFIKLNSEQNILDGCCDSVTIDWERNVQRSRYIYGSVLLDSAISTMVPSGRVPKSLGPL